MPKPRSPLQLPVRTVSGQSLGRIVDIEIDPDTQGIIAYHVKPNRLLPDVVASPMIIHPSQVVEFTATAMIVDDANVGQKQPAPQPSA